MWRMLRHETAKKYVLASGISHSLEEFVAAAFNEVKLDWRDHVDHAPSLARSPIRSCLFRRQRGEGQPIARLAAESRICRDSRADGLCRARRGAGRLGNGVNEMGPQVFWVLGPLPALSSVSSAAIPRHFGPDMRAWTSASYPKASDAMGATAQARPRPDY
jgi:hypothetical protein